MGLTLHVYELVVTIEEILTIAIVGSTIEYIEFSAPPVDQWRVHVY